MECEDRDADALGGSLRIARRSPPAKMAMTMSRQEATSKTRQLHRRERAATSSVCTALARREVSGNAGLQLRRLTLPRAQWALHSVLQHEENLVLLGFSSDGHFLLYYSWWESSYELQWKQVQFSSQSGTFVRHRACFQLPVGADAAAFGEHDNSASSLANGVGSALKVWQSCDDALVIAFGTDRQHLTSQESSQIYYVSVAPSPSYAGAHAASDISSLRFVYTVQSPCQEPGSWQLLQVSPREHRNIYHLVVNMGTSVAILVFAIVSKYDKSSDSSKSRSSVDHGVAAPFSGAIGSLGVHHFAQSKRGGSRWYQDMGAVLDFVCSRPVGCAHFLLLEFPVEFQAEVFQKQPQSMNKTDAYSIAVEASEMESALFMSCVMELESSTLVLGANSTSQMHRQIVMALSFSLDIKTGEYTIIRALKLPRQQNLRQLSKSMAYKYKTDINRRVPSRDEPATWSNAPVAQEQSLLPAAKTENTKLEVQAKERKRKNIGKGAGGKWQQGAKSVKVVMATMSRTPMLKTRIPAARRPGINMLSVLFIVLVAALAPIVHATYAPNHFLGTCLDDAWVASMKTANQERDSEGRLVHPFLQPALKYPRYQLYDIRTAAEGVYADDCIPSGAFIYGAGAEVGADGAATNKGKINGTVVMELSGWNTHTLTTLVFSILLAEVYGYEVSHYYVTSTLDLTQRMSSARSGICTPTHINMEVWIAGIEAALQVYSNESYTAGGVGYFGRSGLYTTHDFVVSSLDASQHSPVIYADYWKNYKYDENLLKSVPVASLRNNAKYFPPAEVGCADDSFGCKNHCSRTKACTDRENQGGGKECIVVIMMYDYYDPGYLQAVLANNDIPAYFCFIGYEGAQNFALDAQKSGQPVLFYHFEPDLFHFNYPGLFDRVFLPRSVPESVVLATGTFGENGYGEKTDNPVDVDFPTTTLTKYAASLVINQQIGPLLSKFSLSDLNINDMLRKYLAASSDPAEPDPSFRAACSWVKENYAVWNLWLDRPPLCAFESHIKYHVTGCENGSITCTISFEWRHPNPVNASLAYDCDGGVAQLPDAIVTSRSCEWILQDDRQWIDWTTTKPTCDASFYKYSITGCDSASKRTVQYFWLLANPSDLTKSVECEGGSALPASVQIDCEYMPFSSPIFLVMSVIAIVIALALAVAMIFVYQHRRAPIIKRSQFELLELMIFGGLLICGAAIVYAGKPTDLLCALRPVLVSTGFTTIFGTLVVKSLRVYRVFMRSSMKRVTLTTKKMLKFLSIFYVVDVIIFAAWFGVAFPKPTITIEDAVEFQGEVDRILCESSSFIFTALLIFWKAILLFLGLYISFLIRNVSSDFQESTWIFASAMVVLVGSLVILPLGYLVKMAAAPFYVFLACSFLVCTGLIMGFMLVPKLFHLSEMPRASDATKNTTKFGDRRGSGNAGASKYDDDSTNVGTTQSTQLKPKAKYTVTPLHRHASM